MLKYSPKSFDRLLKHRIIAVDIYDTLIMRMCSSPEVVFDWVEYKYNADNDDRIEGFKHNRMNAEKACRSAAKGGEITFDQIYKQLETCYQFVDKLKNYEIQIEELISVANREVRELLEQMASAGKRVVLISDMYLPRRVIEQILERNSIKNYGELYLSSEIGVTKRSGLLYQHMLKMERALPEEVCCIGNDIVSDYIVARGNGIKSFWYRRGKIVTFLKERTTYKDEREILQFDFIKNAAAFLEHDNHLNERIGYEVIGPILLGYAFWLQRIAKRDNASKILFLSREGDIMRMVYKMVIPQEEQISSLYINVSGIALRRSRVVDVSSFQELKRLFKRYFRTIETLADFIEVLGLDKQSMQSFLKQEGFNLEDRVEDIRETDKLYTLIRRHDGGFFDLQARLLQEYISDRVMPGDKIIVSDIGWSGYVQTVLQEIMPNSSFSGAYLAVSDLYRTQEYMKSERHGYCCEVNEWGSKGQIFRFSQSAMETLLLNHEKSTVSYIKNENTVFPVKEGLPMDAVMVDGIRDGVRDLWKKTNGFILNIIGDELSADVMLSGYIGFAVKPIRETLDFFKSLTFEDGNHIGGFLPTKKLGYYMLHPSKLLKEFNLCNSKIIWLKGFLPLPLPYYRMLRFVSRDLGVKSRYEKRFFEEIKDSE